MIKPLILSLTLMLLLSGCPITVQDDPQVFPMDGVAEIQANKC